MISGKRKFSDPLESSRFSKNTGRNAKDSNLYFVSHYGTPQRAAKVKPPPIHKVTSVTNLSCTSFRARGPLSSLRCSRSLSLQDLSPGLQTHLMKRRARLCKQKQTILTDMPEGANGVTNRMKVLAYKAYCGFLRNAWKKRREESEVQDVRLRSANGQISHLKIQITTLKSILKADEQVISGSFREINNLKSLLSKLNDQYVISKKEREEAREALESIKEELHGVRTESLNDKNSLMLAKSEAAALEAQLGKEREKIAKLKTEYKSMLEKVDKYANNLKNKSDKICRLSENVDQLEKQMSSCTQLLRNSQIKIDQDQRALEEASGCLRGLKKELAESETREGRMRAQVDELTLKMREQAHHYSNVIKEQNLKMVRLETELALREADPAKSWLVKMISSALNLPLLLVMAINKREAAVF